MLIKKLKLEVFRDPRLLVLVCPFLLLAPVWLTGKALYWGTPSTQFIPWWWQAWQALLGGELPLWNPLVGMGAPLLANYQSALFYPPTWIYFLLAATGGLPLMAWGQALLVASHLAIAGWGMLTLLKRLGLGELAQTVGALAFSLSGYLVARAHFLCINAAIAWLPWILLAAYELAHKPASKRAIFKLAAFLALQWLAGHAQMSWYTLLLAIGWTTFWARQAGTLAAISRALLRFAAAALLAFALSGVQLLPTAEYLLQSPRAMQVAADAAMAYSFWPWRFLNLLAPNLFGNPALGNFSGYGNYWEDAVYVGFLPLALMLAALWSARKKNKSRPLAFLMAALVLVSFLLALGDRTPIFPWLYEHIPSFNMFQAPTRFSIWMVFALCLLAAIAADKWRRPVGRALYWSRLAGAGSAAIVFGAGIASWLNASDKIHIQPTFITATFSAGIFAFGAALLNLGAPKRSQANRTWSWLVCFLLAADLLYAGWGLNPGATLDLYKDDPELHAGLRDELGDGRLYLPPEDEGNLKYNFLFRFDTFFSEDPRTIRATLLPNINLLDRIPTANNFDPLVPARYKSWVDALADADGEIHSQMLARMSVSVIERLISGEGASVSFEPVESLPRARWVNCAHPVANAQQALEAIASGEFDPLQEIAVETPTGQACGSSTTGSADLVSSSANRVLVSVDAPGGGWLVLADTWFPGWHAYANGSELPIYVAEGMFRAVELPVGQYNVEFVYSPLSFSVGALLTLLSFPTFFLLWRRWKNA